MKLRAEELVKKYKSRTVVKGVSVNVGQGEMVGLLGPNGAGKTTSFYMIVGLIKPNGGRIFLDDTEITTEPVYRRAQLGVGYLAQEASVFRQLSVEDNIKAVLEMSNLPKDYQRHRLEEMLDEFGLQHIRKSKGIQLSGGERRRTEIARALSIAPKFILLVILNRLPALNVPHSPPNRKTSEETPSRHGFVVNDIPTLDELERRYLEYVFNIASGCVYGEKGMTELLNLKRSTLYTKLKKHGIMLR